MVLPTDILYFHLILQRLSFCLCRTGGIFNALISPFFWPSQDGIFKHHLMIYSPWSLLLNILPFLTCYLLWHLSCIHLLFFHVTAIICFILIHCHLFLENSSILLVLAGTKRDPHITGYFILQCLILQSIPLLFLKGSVATVIYHWVSMVTSEMQLFLLLIFLHQKMTFRRCQQNDIWPLRKPQKTQKPAISALYSSPSCLIKTAT